MAERQVPVTETGNPPYYAVGWLWMWGLDSETGQRGWSVGSGALIDNIHVLTCSHNLTEQKNIEIKDPNVAEKVIFFPQFNTAYPKAEPPSTGGIPAYACFYSNSYQNGEDSMDVGLVELTKPVDLKFYFARRKISKPEQVLEMDVAITGYPGNHEGEMWTDDDDEINWVDIENNLVLYTNDTMPGSSGSPVYTYEKGTDLIKQYAIHVARASVDRMFENRRGVLLTPKINEWIDRALLTAPQQFMTGL